jgi:hypothetical protein
MPAQFRCYLCNSTKAIPAICWHTDSNGKEFGVRTKEITITPAKPKENGYQAYRKPVECKS